ncbi:CHAT domain-containing protein [Streptomyces sannanensis]|uniref:CHAT domain-containing protein n=1 Tax=Streptomyces sannanensis TaxID=285536 RepID=UPI0031E9ABCB
MISAKPADRRRPTVWWAPDGLLGQLPLHAAGHYDDPAGSPGRRTVLDRVVPSYTPTVRALRHARQRASAPPARTPAGLIVAMPTTPGVERDLRFVPDDVEAVRSRLPRGRGGEAVRHRGTAAETCRRPDAAARLPRPCGPRTCMSERERAPVQVAGRRRARRPRTCSAIRAQPSTHHRTRCGRTGSG